VLKEPIGISVLEAARQRIAWTFDNFERIYLSFSAGKDSTIMLHLVADEAQKRGRSFGLLLVDLEAQYKLTMDHALACVEMYRGLIDLHWICLPIHLRNAVSVYEPFWMCWDPANKDGWVRTPPECATTDPASLPFFHSGMEFEEFVPAFGKWYGGGKLTACSAGTHKTQSTGSSLKGLISCSIILISLILWMRSFSGNDSICFKIASIVAFSFSLSFGILHMLQTLFV